MLLHHLPTPRPQSESRPANGFEPSGPGGRSSVLQHAANAIPKRADIAALMRLRVLQPVRTPTQLSLFVKPESAVRQGFTD